MGANVDFFFNSTLNLEDLVDRINRLLGCRLASSDDPNHYSTWFFGSNLVLVPTIECDLEPVGELNFDAYRFMIGGSFRPTKLEVLTLIASLLYEYDYAKEGMLVLDVQVLLARYSKRGKNWFDEVSGKTVSLPGHLIDVNFRLPNRFGSHE